MTEDMLRFIGAIAIFVLGYAVGWMTRDIQR